MNAAQSWAQVAYRATQAPMPLLLAPADPAALERQLVPTVAPLPDIIEPAITQQIAAVQAPGA
jgi:hypothetical protein